jgi:hypothetical protein
VKAIRSDTARNPVVKGYDTFRTGTDEDEISGEFLQRGRVCTHSIGPKSRKPISNADGYLFVDFSAAGGDGLNDSRVLLMLSTSCWMII